MDDVKIFQKKPFITKLKAGTYAWCACGRSENNPYCDGSHKVTDIKPIIETIDEAKTVAWCGCKHSGAKPYCDGSHSRL